MANALQGIPIVALLVAATLLEVSGDAVVRVAIYNHAGVARVGLFLAGAALLLGYGTLLNLAPLQFGQVVGIYLATLFVIWQVINFVAFRALPTLPIILGGSLIIAGGAMVTFWKST
jgi:small multidrug resistance family-3 protein